MVLTTSTSPGRTSWGRSRTRRWWSAAGVGADEKAGGVARLGWRWAMAASGRSYSGTSIANEDTRGSRGLLRCIDSEFRCVWVPGHISKTRLATFDALARRQP